MADAPERADAAGQTLPKAGLLEFTWPALSTGWVGSDGFTGWNMRQDKVLCGLPFEHDSHETSGNFGGFKVGRRRWRRARRSGHGTAGVGVAHRLHVCQLGMK